MSHPKGVLIERAQKLGLGKPEFRTEQTGPEHEPRFLSDVVIDGEVLGTGQGGTKRTAEKYAAEEALAALDARTQPTGKASGKKSAQPAKAAGGKKGKGGATDGGKGAKSQEGKPVEDELKRGGATAAAAVDAAGARSRAEAASAEDEDFDGPWPMFDDLLASVVTVAEKRVTSELRGEGARAAIRDFSLSLYKDLLLGLGDIVEDEEEDEEGD